MKKLLLAALAFIGVMSSAPSAKAADTYGAFGKWVSDVLQYAEWSEGKLPTFEQYFANRIKSNSSDYEARILHAAVLVAELAENETFKTYMARFGLEIDYMGLSLEGKSSDPLTWPDPNELVDAAVSECEPKLNAALNDLNVIPSGWKGSVCLPANVFGFNDDTFFESDVYVDEADVLVARAAIEEMLGLLYFLKGYDLTVDWAKVSLMSIPKIPVLKSAPAVSSTTGWSGALTIPVTGWWWEDGPQGYVGGDNARAGVQFALNGSRLYVRAESNVIGFEGKDDYDDKWTDFYFEVGNPADGQRYEIDVYGEGRAYICNTYDYSSWEECSASVQFENGVVVAVVDLSGTKLDGVRNSGLLLAADRVGVYYGIGSYQDDVWRNKGYEAWTDGDSDNVYTVTKFWSEQSGFLASVRSAKSLATSKEHMLSAVDYAIKAFSAAKNRPADGHYHFIEYDPAYSGDLAKAANFALNARAALTTATKIDVANTFDVDCSFLPGNGLIKVYLGALFDGKLVRDSLPLASSIDRCGNLELYGKIKDPTVNGALPDFTATAWGLLYDRYLGCPNDIPGSVIWRTVTFNAASGSVSEKSRVVRDGMPLGELPEPVRTGYSFTGWYTASSGGSQVSLHTVAVLDMTLYARWALKTYTLTLDPNDGTYKGTTAAHVIPNSSQTAKPTYGKGYYWRVGAATRAGYTFAGWYSAKTGGEKVFDANGDAVGGSYWSVSGSAATWKHDGDVTVYARWMPKTYKLTLNPNGGTYKSSTAAHVIPNSSQTTKPTYGKGYYWRVGAATRAGYTFAGWYSAKTGGEKVFDANGDAVGGSYWSVSGSAATWKHDGDVTVYARWTPKTYKLTLNPNGGTYKSTTAAHVIPNSSQTTKPTYGKNYYWRVGAATRAGYKFAGWYSAKTGGEKVFDANGDAVGGSYWSASGSAATWKYVGDVTVYARWTAAAPKTYTLTLDPNGGKYSGSTAAHVIPNSSQTTKPTYGKSYYWRVGAATRAGYKFAGWYSAKTGGEKVFDTNGEAVSGTYWSASGSAATWKYDGNVTVYARWTPIASKTYTLTLDPNGGKYSGSTAAHVIPNSSQTTKPTYGKANYWRVGAATRVGYIFTGWYSAKTGGEKMYDANGEAVSGTYWSASGSAATWKYDGNVTVYAQWSPKTYTLTLNPNGGKYSGSTAAHVIPNSSQTTKPTYGKANYWRVGAATRAGYTFVGWYSAETGGKMVYDSKGEAVKGDYWSASGSTATWKYDGNVTVYAHWSSAMASSVSEPLDYAPAPVCD